MKYLLDANVFIEAYKRYYHNEIVSSFWQWLTDDEEIYTIPKVKDEIKDGNDELYVLIKEVKTINNVQRLNEVSENVVKSYTNQAVIDEFFSKADPLLIASGVGNNEITVVTNEVLVGKDSNKIKIPNICKNLNVKYKNDIFSILKSKQIDLSNYR